MKIYTKTGDGGQTGLFGGPRVRKDDPRIEAYGAVDELNAHLGFARAHGLPADVDALVATIQAELFAVGAELATPDPARHDTQFVDGAMITQLEHAIDQFESELQPLKQFILPVGAPAASALHVARTVCRRAERRIVTLAHSSGESVSSAVVTYVNRLGDLLFVLARTANSRAGAAEEPWNPPKPGEKS